MFILGFLVFQPTIRSILNKIYGQSEIPFNRKKHFKYIFVTILFFSCLISLALFCVVSIYHHQYGVPEFHQLREQILNFKTRDLNSTKHMFPRHHIHPFSASMYVPSFIGGSALLFLSLFGIEEYFRYNKSLQEKELKKEQNAKEVALSKVYAFQHQLNPHFMFNTLNVLSGLIHEDLKKADVFIKKLSEIYRYVLLQSEEIVSTLDKEIEFSKAYIYLLKIRFEDKLFVNIDIPKDKLNYLVPSLTLELLIENAIKHNSLDSKDPIIIEIYTEGDFLIVKNNMLPRMDKSNSLGIGIKNLEKRLSALGIFSASFEATKEYYVAKVPLINQYND